MNPRTLTLLCMIATLSPITQTNATETGSQAPDCVLTSIGDTQSYRLQQFRGKVLYIDFWASWCPPCLKSFPFMNDLQRDLKEQGLQVIAINLDEVAEDADAFLAKYPTKFTVVSDAGQQCARNFDVKAMPSSYLVDRDGIIRHVHLGFRPGETQALVAKTKQLLAEGTEAQEHKSSR